MPASGDPAEPDDRDAAGSTGRSRSRLADAVTMLPAVLLPYLAAWYGIRHHVRWYFTVPAAAACALAGYLLYGAAARLRRPGR